MKKAFLTATALLATLIFSWADLAYILEPLSASNVRAAKKEVEKIVARNESRPTPVLETIQPESPSKTPVVAPENEAKVHRLTITNVIQELGQVLAAQLDIEGELRLLPLRTWKEILLKSDDYHIEFWGYPVDGLKSNISISFKVVSDDKDIGTWTLPIKCELWKNIYFATQRLNRGIEIDESRLKIQPVDVLRLPQSAVTEDIELASYEVSSTIPAGKPLLWNSIVVRPDVRRGKVVELVAQEGSMRITAKGVALQNGIVNDFIGVRNLQSRKDIQAQIIDENTVRVYF